ncbi:MAG TPA: hypothetical protein VI030_05200 [Propionibacteriaceae bacterium]
MTKEHLFHIRPVGSLVEETHETGHELKRAVGPVSLTALGVGAIVGTGIFVVVGVAPARAGPAATISFVLAAPDLPEIEPDADAPETPTPEAR